MRCAGLVDVPSSLAGCSGNGWLSLDGGTSSRRSARVRYENERYRTMLVPAVVFVFLAPCSDVRSGPKMASLASP